MLYMFVSSEPWVQEIYPGGSICLVITAALAAAAALIADLKLGGWVEVWRTKRGGECFVEWKRFVATNRVIQIDSRRPERSVCTPFSFAQKPILISPALYRELPIVLGECLSNWTSNTVLYYVLTSLIVLATCLALSVLRSISGSPLLLLPLLLHG